MSAQAIVYLTTDELFEMAASKFQEARDSENSHTGVWLAKPRPTEGGAIRSASLTKKLNL
jgi:hypothetical protein